MKASASAEYLAKRDPAEVQAWVLGPGKGEVDAEFLARWRAGQPRSALAQLESARHAEVASRFAEALTFYDAAAARDPTLAEAVTGAARVAARVQVALDLAQFRSARGGWRALLATPASAIQLLRSAAKQVEPQAMFDVAYAACDRYPHNPLVLREALTFLKGLGALEAVRNLAARVYALSPTAEAAAEHLAALSALRDFGAFHTALKAMQPSVQVSAPVAPVLIDTHERRGEIVQAVGRIDARIAAGSAGPADWQRALRLAPYLESRSAVLDRLAAAREQLTAAPHLSTQVALGLLNCGDPEAAWEVAAALASPTKAAALRATLHFELDEIDAGDAQVDLMMSGMDARAPWSDLIVVHQRRTQAIQRRRWTAADSDRPDDIQEVERESRETLRRLWQASVRQNPASLASVLALADAHAALDEEHGARSSLAQARLLAADNPRVLLSEARIASRFEPAEQARPRWQALIDATGDPDMLAAAAGALFQDSEAGALQLAKSVEAFPYHLGLRRALAVAYARLGRLRDGLQQWRFVTARAAAASTDYVAYARALMSLLLLDEADGVLAEAVRIWPGHGAWPVLRDEVEAMRAAAEFADVAGRSLPAAPRWTEHGAPILVEVVNAGAPPFLLTTLIAARAVQRVKGGSIVAVGVKPVSATAKMICTAFGVSQIIEVDPQDAELQSFEPVLKALAALRGPALRRAVEDLRIGTLLVGDLLYDQLLKFEGRATIDAVDSALIKHLRELHALHAGYDAVFKALKPRQVVVGHHPYLRHGLLLRLATAHGVEIALRDPPTKDATMVRFRTEAEVFHGPGPFNKRLADAISDEVGAEMERRGAALLAKSFGEAVLTTLDMRSTHGARLSAEVAAFRQALGFTKPRPLVIVFDHVPNDYVHGGRWKNFVDYVDWLEKTIAIAKTIPTHDWVVKLHPVAKYYGLDSELYQRRVEAMAALAPNIRVVGGRLSAELMSAAADAVVTARGTAAIEYPALGTPTIITADAPFGGYPFVISAEDDAAYVAALTAIKAGQRLSSAQIRSARRFLGFYHEALQAPSALIPRLPGDREDFRGFIWWETYNKAQYWRDAARLFEQTRFAEDTFVKAVAKLFSSGERIIVDVDLLGLSTDDPRRAILQTWFR